VTLDHPLGVVRAALLITKLVGHDAHGMLSSELGWIASSGSLVVDPKKLPDCTGVAIRAS